MWTALAVGLTWAAIFVFIGAFGWGLARAAGRPRPPMPPRCHDCDRRMDLEAYSGRAVYYRCGHCYTHTETQRGILP